MTQNTKHMPLTWVIIISAVLLALVHLWELVMGVFDWSVDLKSVVRAWLSPLGNLLAVIFYSALSWRLYRSGRVRSS